MWPRMARVCDYQDQAAVGGIVAVVLSEPSEMPVTLKKGARSGKVVATTSILIGDPVRRRIANNGDGLMLTARRTACLLW